MSVERGLHEDLAREDDVRAGSNRSFGITIGTVLVLISMLSFWHRGTYAWWWLGAGVAFAIAGLATPALLGPLNRLWFRFGLLLHRIVSPVVLGLMFFTVITPLGLLMRILGKRPLGLRVERSTAGSYWIKREPPGPARDSFPNQF